MLQHNPHFSALAAKSGNQPHHSQFGLTSSFGTFFSMRQYPKVQKVPKHPFPDFLPTSTYIPYMSIAVPSADWAMISNRPGNNIKREQHTIPCNVLHFLYPG